MSEQTVLLERRAGWAKVILNRPDRLNAFNEEMHKALADTLADLAADETCRAVLLTGSGRGFCAGQDLSARGGPVDLGDSLERFYNPLVRRIRGMRKPVVCAVNGVAAGAGANLALACDIVVAAHSARFLQAFARIGLVPDSGGTYFLPRLIGDARARAIAMLAEPVDAVTAESWGMIWKALPDDFLMSEAELLTEQLANAPTQALALMKESFNASASHDLDAQLDIERDLQRRAGRTPDFGEGVRAFMEKRPAVFTGRAP